MLLTQFSVDDRIVLVSTIVLFCNICCLEDYVRGCRIRTHNDGESGMVLLFEDLTQNEIANLLNVNRTRVIKLLNKARKTGIVRFVLRRDSELRVNLHKQLLQAFNLKDAFIIPEVPDENDLNTSIAQAAAIYINDMFQNMDMINIGYGDTPSKVLNHLATMAQKPISCVSLTGGVNYYLPDTKSGIFNAKLHLCLFRFCVPLKKWLRRCITSLNLLIFHE